MKRLLNRFFLMVFVVVLPAITVHGEIEGLSPPAGPPGPVMKTLDEIEPRVAISELPATISEAGSYYLAGNLAGVESEDGITIEADDVTIDLMGFKLEGEGVAANGIIVQGDRITIRNGNISGFSGDGVQGVLGESGQHWNLDGLRITGNGGAGIQRIGNYGTIRDATVVGNGGGGITGGSEIRVETSTIAENGWGILVDGVVISGSTVSANSGVGIEAVSVAMSNCRVLGNEGHGIFVVMVSNTFCRIDDSVVAANEGDGIRIAPGGLNWEFEPTAEESMLTREISRTTLVRNSGTGVRIEGGLTKIEGSYIAGNTVGIEVLSAGNTIVRNTASSNTDGNFSIVEGNEVGPIGTMSEVGEHPWANFSIGESAE